MKRTPIFSLSRPMALLTLSIALGLMSDVHSFPFVGAVTAAHADDEGELIVNKFQFALGRYSENLKIKVIPLPGMTYAVVLAGEMDADKVPLAIKAAEAVRRDLAKEITDVDTEGLVASKPKFISDDQVRRSRQIQELFGLMLDNPAVKIRVQVPALMAKQDYIVVLTGPVSTVEIADIRKNIPKYRETAARVLGLSVSDVVADFLSPSNSRVSVWPLTFVHALIPNPTPTGLDVTALAVTTPSTAEKIAASLSAFVGDGVTIQALSNSLLIKGEESKVRRVKTLLARDIDIPFPQVSLDVWTIQVNVKSTRDRSKEKAQEKMSDIKAGIQLTRDLESELLNTIMTFLRDKDVLDFPLKSASAKPVDHIENLLNLAGFDTSPKHPLSVVDMLTFLSLCRQDKLKGSDSSTLDSKLNEAVEKFTRTKKTDGTLGRRNACLDSLLARIRATVASQKNEFSSGAMPHLLGVYAGSDRDSTLSGIANFLHCWLSINGKADELKAMGMTEFPKDDVAVALSHSSAETDDLLKYGSDALHTDIKALCMKPLLDWIREDVQHSNAGSSGIDLVGNTSIVVTSRQPVQTVASAETFFPFTPRPRLTEQTLADAKTLSDGSSSGGKKTGTQTDVTKTTDSSTGKGDNKASSDKSTESTTAKDILSAATSAATTALGTISPLEALAVKAIFASEPDTVYNRVAPGISLGIRPTVFRDGGTARLQINLTANMDTAHTNSPNANGIPYDIIRGHSLQTDIAVRALDIFELSTFGMETTGPGEPTYRIPLLEMLPVIGKYFVGPARRETKHQESLLIVNVTILPRSLDLADRRLSSYP